MLDLFTKSNIRKRIILLFIYNQNKEFYLSEIAKAVGTSAGTAQRELNKLLKSDLIEFKKKAGLNIYTLNKGYSLLKEVESIIRKTIGVEEELKKYLKKVEGVKFSFLFGSYVKGGVKSNSDIDLFVVGNVDDNSIFNAVQQAERIIDREINYHLANEKEFSRGIKNRTFIKDIIKNYILLTGEAHEFRKYIKQPD